MASSDEIKKQLSSLGILDKEQVLERLSGNKSIYQSLLRKFAEKHKSEKIVISTALSDKEFADLEHKIHQIVAEADKLGLTRLKYICQICDDLAKKKSAPDLLSCLDVLNTEMELAIKNIGEYAKPRDTSES